MAELGRRIAATEGQIKSLEEKNEELDYEAGYLLWDEVNGEKVCVYHLRTSQELAPIRIEKLKGQLADTDYQAIKYAEGQISEEDYAPIKAQRQSWRDEINELEKEI